MIAEFLSSTWTVVIFYVIIFFLIIKNRKKFDVQGKVIFLYKTKIGIKLMKKFARELSPKAHNLGKILFKISIALSVLF